MLYKEKRKIVTLISYCHGMPLGHVDAKKLEQTFLMLVQTVHLGKKIDLTAQKGKIKG